MFNLLTNALAAVKDRAVGNSAKAFINRKIEKIGIVTSLTLDSRQKTIALEAELKGEASIITILVGAYEVIQRNGGTFIIVRRAEASREWITAALNEFVVGQEIKLPDALKMAL